MRIFEYNKWLTLNGTNISYNKYSLVLSNNKRERKWKALIRMLKKLITGQFDPYRTNMSIRMDIGLWSKSGV